MGVPPGQEKNADNFQSFANVIKRISSRETLRHVLKGTCFSLPIDKHYRAYLLLSILFCVCCALSNIHRSSFSDVFLVFAFFLNFVFVLLDYLC